MILAYISIPGEPVCLKNSKRLVKVGNRLIPIESKKVARYRKAVMPLLLSVWRGKPPITCPVNAQVLFYGPWKGEARVPDLDNLLGMPCDALEAAGILQDDVLIEGFDGSRRIRMCATCEDRPVLKSGPRKGQRKDDCGAVKKCPYVRVEIELTEWNEATHAGG